MPCLRRLQIYLYAGDTAAAAGGAFKELVTVSSCRVGSGEIVEDSTLASAAVPVRQPSWYQQRGTWYTQLEIITSSVLKPYCPRDSRDPQLTSNREQSSKHPLYFP